MKIILKKCITLVIFLFVLSNQAFAADFDQQPQKIKPEKIRRGSLIVAGAGLGAVCAILEGQGLSIDANFHNLMIPCGVLGGMWGLSTANLLEGQGRRGWVTLNSTMGGAVLGALFGLVEGERHMNGVLAMVCAAGGGLTGFLAGAGYEIGKAVRPLIVTEPNNQIGSNGEEAAAGTVVSPDPAAMEPTPPSLYRCVDETTGIEDETEDATRAGETAKDAVQEEVETYCCVAIPVETEGEAAPEQVRAHFCVAMDRTETEEVRATRKEFRTLPFGKTRPKLLPRFPYRSTNKHFSRKFGHYSSNFSQQVAVSCLPKHFSRIRRIR